MITSSLFRAPLFYAGFLAVMAILAVFAGRAASSLLLAQLVATAVLVAAFGYGAASGQTVAQVALVLLGLGPVLSFGIRAAEVGLGAWTMLGLLIRGLAAVGGIVLSGLAVHRILNDSDGSRNVAPCA
jgi:hypothetical protein